MQQPYGIVSASDVQSQKAPTKCMRRELRQSLRMTCPKRLPFSSARALLSLYQAARCKCPVLACFWLVGKSPLVLITLCASEILRAVRTCKSNLNQCTPGGNSGMPV